MEPRFETAPIQILDNTEELMTSHMLFNEETLQESALPEDSSTTSMFRHGDQNTYSTILNQGDFKTSPIEKVPHYLNSERQMNSQFEDGKDKPKKKKSVKKINQRSFEERVIFAADSEEKARKWVYLIQWLIKQRKASNSTHNMLQF